MRRCGASRTGPRRASSGDEESSTGDDGVGQPKRRKSRLVSTRRILNSCSRSYSVSSFNYRQRRKQEEAALKALVHQLEVLL